MDEMSGVGGRFGACHAYRQLSLKNKIEFTISHLEGVDDGDAAHHSRLETELHAAAGRLVRIREKTLDLS